MTVVIETSRAVSAGDELAEANTATNTHRLFASATLLAGSHTLSDTQDGSAPAFNLGSSQLPNDAQERAAAADHSPAGGQGRPDAQSLHAPGGFLRDPVLGVLADVVDDLESVRIANANRVRQLTRTGADKDGEERGFGLTADHPEVAKLIVTVAALEAAEKDAIKNLERAMLKHPLAGFQKRHKGIGKKQLARLLAVIGDPYWNDLYDRPRTVSELWAYCGLHVIRTSSNSQTVPESHTRGAVAGAQPHTGSHSTRDTQQLGAPGVAPKRQRGQKSNWNETARKRIWVIASAMPKFPGGKYEQVYRDARAKYADALHPTDCVRCGPAGKPAPAGTPLSPGHQNARAHRLVAKEILKDLWIEARDLYHQEQHGHDEELS
ncbi:TIGR-Tas system RNA-guided endonuclease [Nocardia farcinica]|uniref:hypothetical protein n=1 Tax=Nocardia farcinica TaxID=37329 RepID=UPI001E326C42|nr:hypothetical protein [Nocardia farcinica]